MKIIPLKVDDIIELKKPHPCSSRRFRVIRVGSDVRIICCGCGRDMTLDRVRLEASIKSVNPNS